MKLHQGEAMLVPWRTEKIPHTFEAKKKKRLNSCLQRPVALLLFICEEKKHFGYWKVNHYQISILFSLSVIINFMQRLFVCVFSPLLYVCQHKFPYHFFLHSLGVDFFVCLFSPMLETLLSVKDERELWVEVLRSKSCLGWAVGIWQSLCMILYFHKMWTLYISLICVIFNILTSKRFWGTINTSKGF